MYNLFLEDGDLLESVEFNMIFTDQYIEESVKIDKSRLNDKKYIKSIINKINNTKDQKEKISLILAIIAAISMMTIIGIPVGILLALLATQVQKNAKKMELKDLEKVSKLIEKSVSDLSKQYESSSDKNEKKELKSIIDKLEKNNKEIEITIDKIKNPLKYKKKNPDAVKAVDICVSKLKELLSKPKYSDLKSAIDIDPNMTGLYDEFIWGDEDYLDIVDYDTNKINKLIDAGKYEDWDDIFNLMDELMNDVNKFLDGKYKLEYGEDSGVDRGGFAIILK